MNVYYAKLQATWTVSYAIVFNFRGRGRRLPLRISDQGLPLNSAGGSLLDFRHISTDNFWIGSDARSEQFKYHDDTRVLGQQLVLFFS